MSAPISRGPVTVLWDYENCPAPAADRAYIDGTTLVERLCKEFLKFGPIVEVKTFGNVSTIRAAMREELQTSAVTVIDAQSVDKRKDLVDKMIFTHMFCFALDHPPPATIVLISGDVDYALPLAMLKLRQYHVVLVKPSGRNVNQKLLGIAHEIYDWEDLLFPERLASDISELALPAHPKEAHHKHAAVSHAKKETVDRSPSMARPTTKPTTISSILPVTSQPVSVLGGRSPEHTAEGSPSTQPQAAATMNKTTKDGGVKETTTTITTTTTATNNTPTSSPITVTTTLTPTRASLPLPAISHAKEASDKEEEDSEEDNASSISDVAARIHLRDFIYVLTELHSAGDHQPLITKVGSRLHERYPKLFKKGTATRLAMEAQKAKLLQITGTPPQRRLKFTASVLFDYLEMNDD